MESCDFSCPVLLTTEENYAERQQIGALSAQLSSQAFNLDMSQPLFSDSSFFTGSIKALDRAGRWLEGNGVDILACAFDPFLPQNLVKRLKDLARADTGVKKMLTRCACENMLSGCTVRNQYGESVTLETLLFAKGGPKFALEELVYVRSLPGSRLGLYTVLDKENGTLLLREDFVQDGGKEIEAHAGPLAVLFSRGEHRGLRLLGVNEAFYIGNAIYPLSEEGYAALHERIAEILLSEGLDRDERESLVDACLQAGACLWVPTIEKMLAGHFRVSRHRCTELLPGKPHGRFYDE